MTNVIRIIRCSKQATLADVIARLGRLTSLAPKRRRDLLSAVATAARLLNSPPADVPADVSILRERLANVHHVQAGISPKRLANVKADLLAALVAVRHMPGKDTTGRIERTPEWKAFLVSLPTDWARHALARLATFCSANGIAPGEVCDAVIARFRLHLADHCLAKDPDKVRKVVTQTWNGIVRRQGLALEVLTIPRAKCYQAIPLTAFTASFQEDVRRWLERLSKVDFWEEEGPAKPLKPVSIRNVKATIRQFASALVHRGRPIADITSLDSLVELDAYKEGLRFFLERNGGKPQTWLSGMAGALLAIARHHVRLPQDRINQLAAIKAKLKVDGGGLTDKNRERLRQFDDPHNVHLLMDLPRRLLERAEKRQVKSSRVALSVMHAVAIDILLACPMRINNLAGLDIARHLKWQGQGNAQTLTLFIPAAEVKNNEAIEARLPRDTTRLIRTYLKTYRHLLSDDPGDWLFPRQTGGPRAPRHFGDELSKVIYRQTGLVTNPHFFRHLAGKFQLDFQPGAHERVRQILGHKRSSTTTAFYTGLNSKKAIEHYHREVLAKLKKA